MGSAPRFTVGLAAFALLLAGGAGIAAAGQADGGLDRQPRAWDSKKDLRSAEAARGRESRRPGRASAEKQAPAASAPSNGSSGSRSTGPAASSGAASPTGQAHASPVASAPPLSGLSHDAPETAPNVGVIGGGGSSGPSPASTPEPSTLLLMGAGLAGLYRLRRQR